MSEAEEKPDTGGGGGGGGGGDANPIITIRVVDQVRPKTTCRPTESLRERGVCCIPSFFLPPKRGGLENTRSGALCGLFIIDILLLNS